ncbi:MAG: peptide/nickel transport system permease protein [Frankiales bacterium]|jgi:peptide/nickel transport system permease protein|nr:peptide/nickel transport system permease protein [Frankiales bacterium]
MEIVDVSKEQVPPQTPLAAAQHKRRPKLRITKSKKMLAGLVILGFYVVMGVIGPWIAPYDPNALGDLTGPGGTQSPGGHHLLGQTTIGNDIFSQLLAGTRPTIEVAFLSGVIATALAIVIGITAGYMGGFVDEVLSLTANIFLVLPALPLLIAIGAFLGPDRAGSPWVVSLIIAATGWAWGARVMRAQAMSMRNRDFVEAARVSGESTSRIILAEIMPNLSAVIASSFLFTTIYAIGTYVGLGFLNVVSAGPHYNWGTMLFDATSSSAVEAGSWWWYVPPGLAIAVLGMSLALINFGIDEYINPRLRIAKPAKGTKVKVRPQLGFTPVVRKRPVVDAGPYAAARSQLEEAQ